jgi:FkbM family methyltransferase
MYHVKNGLREVVRLLKGEPPVAPGEFDLGSLPALLGRDDPVILDIGANDGSHTLEFLRLFERSRVYAFEPDPRALESFRARVNSPRAKLYDLAISDADGTTEFHTSGGLPSPELSEWRPRGWDLSGSIRRPKEHLEQHPWCTFGEPIPVRTMRLDTWCREEGVTRIDLIWADVQGAEENLINGAREALRRTRYFYTEYSDRELYEGQIGLREIMNLLPDFEVLRRFANDVLLKNRNPA